MRFCFSGNYTGIVERGGGRGEMKQKNRRDELSSVLSGLFFAIALKSCFRILHVISSESAKDFRTAKRGGEGRRKRE